MVEGVLDVFDYRKLGISPVAEIIVNRAELVSWESVGATACVFEDNWNCGNEYRVLHEQLGVLIFGRSPGQLQLCRLYLLCDVFQTLRCSCERALAR